MPSATCFLIEGIQRERGGDHRIQGPAPRKAFFERPPRHVFHRYVRGTVLRFPAIIDLDDVQVGEGGAPHLALETLDELLVIGELLPQDLERHVPIEDLVVGQAYSGHPSAAQGADDAVTVVYDGFLHITPYLRVPKRYTFCDPTLDGALVDDPVFRDLYGRLAQTLQSRMRGVIGF